MAITPPAQDVKTGPGDPRSGKKAAEVVAVAIAVGVPAADLRAV
jgi:hypothetical protein